MEKKWAHYTEEEMKELNKKNWIADVIAIIVLLACMFAMVKGLPVLMGGAHDATGAAIAIAAPYVQTLL